MRNFYLAILILAFSFGIHAQVTMVTNMPASVAPNANLNIEVKINKGSISNFSKYEIELPEGFSATEGKSKTGYFTFEKNKVKIVWVTLPTESEFIISFKLKTPSNNAPFVLNHKFYYIESGVKKEVIGQQIDVKVEASGVTKTLSYLPEETIIAAEPMNPPVTNNKPPVATQTIASTPSPTVEPVKTVITTPVVVTSNVSINGMIYLVQIGTFTSDPGKAKYSDLGKVTIEKAGTIFKVLIGDFNTKEEAFKKRDELTTKGYNGFVVTYQNGQRVK